MGDWESSTVLPADRPWRERRRERLYRNAIADPRGILFCTQDDCDLRDVWHLGHTPGEENGRRRTGIKKNRGKGRHRGDKR